MTKHLSKIIQKSKLLFLWGSLFLFGTIADAQSVQLQQPISGHYVDMRLSDVLKDLIETYPVHFIYKNDIPANHRVTITTRQQPLSEVLDQILKYTSLKYYTEGQFIILYVENSLDNVDQHLEPLITEPTEFKELSNQNDDLSTTVENNVQNERIYFPDTFPTLFPDVRDAILYPETLTEKNRENQGWNDNFRTANVSIFPSRYANFEGIRPTTNHISLNLLWATNYSVKGFEAGTFVNRINNDVKGMQVAGLGNYVKKDVTGLQIAGVYNHNNGLTKGVQISSFFNYSNSGDAGQFAGLANIIENDFKGLQAAALFNRSGALSNSVQAAGFFNVTKGTTKFQVGGIFNKANEVKGVQLGGVLNVARSVKGVQIAFINVSDTVSGVPIGLINIIKKGGYRRWELSSNEMLHINVVFKLGAPRFYNIFQAGMRLPNQDGLVWGLGYGFGYRAEKTPTFSIVYEGTATQINENESWTNELNMVGKIGAFPSWHIKETKATFFIGPTVNLMISQRENAENNNFGSDLPLYAITEKTSDGGTNYKFWAGISFGFRFR